MGSQMCAAILAQMAITFSPRTHHGLTEGAINLAENRRKLSHFAAKYLRRWLPQAVNLCDDVDVVTGPNIPSSVYSHVPVLGPLISGPAKHGQKHHFMLREEGFAQADSLKECTDWIKDKSRDATQRMMGWFWEPQSGPRRTRDLFTTSHDDDFRDVHDLTGEPLAWALHAVQDSFSPAHVHRNEQEEITRIFAWDKENGDPGPEAGKSGAKEWDEVTNRPGPGWKGHKAYDDAWLEGLQTVDYSSPHVRTAVNACADLLSFTFAAATSSGGDTQRLFDAGMTVFLGKYFRANFRD